MRRTFSNFYWDLSALAIYTDSLVLSVPKPLPAILRALFMTGDTELGVIESITTASPSPTEGAKYSNYKVVLTKVLNSMLTSFIPISAHPGASITALLVNDSKTVASASQSLILIFSLTLAKPEPLTVKL